MKKGISGIVIAYNQGDLLKKCLDSLVSWVDELIVVDLGSTEDVRSIAQKYKATYKKIPYADIVEKVRERVISYASYEYVLFLDPDEVVPAQLAEVIQKTVREGKDEYIRIPRRNIVMGKWLERSRWWPDYQLRVFKKGTVTWPTEIHQEPLFTGQGKTLDPQKECAIVHNNYASIDEWLDKNRRYAKRDALDRLAKKESLTLSETVRLSVSELMSRFFANGGYKDGMHGLVLSVLQSYYYFLMYAYYWEAAGYKTDESADTIYALPYSWFRHGLSETLFWDRSEASKFGKIKRKLVRRMIA